MVQQCGANTDGADMDEPLFLQKQKSESENLPKATPFSTATGGQGDMESLSGMQTEGG